MTQEQKRIAFAKVFPSLKWEVIGLNEQERWVWPSGIVTGPPDDDLNAMHEAEKMLAEKQKKCYPICLARVIRHQFGIDDGESIYHWEFSTFATAAQRFEAFGKTLNLW